MRRLALALAATLACAVPLYAAPAPQDPMDELTGDPNSPQLHLIPPGAHEPMIEESDGTILVGFTTDWPREKVEAFLKAELKKEGWHIAITTELPGGAIYNLEGSDPDGGSITLSIEKPRIRILLSLG
ncbi:MAG: hypothetical protein JOZ72_05765 [Alphaproteobacteria bacterium]|nr:hypothetical protein [Alphaproteobacteria bacterium]